MDSSLLNFFYVAVIGSIVGIAIKYLIDALSSFINDPPGPIGIPILGYYPFIATDPVMGIRRIGEQQGHLFTVNLLNEKYYFLNSVESVKEALTLKGLRTTGRAVEKFNILSTAFSSKSMVSTEGPWWEKHHKFILDNFAAQGVGKIQFEVTVHDMAAILVSNIMSKANQVHDIYEMLTNFSSNVTSQLLFTKHYDYNDPVYIQLRDNVREFFFCVAGLDSILVGQVFHAYFYTKGDKIRRLQNLCGRMIKFWEPLIKERIKLVDRTNAKDLLDFYLAEYKEEQERQEPNPNFDLDTITANFVPMFVGGTETTSSTLYHAINLMVLYPEIQKKVQQEIDTLIGTRQIFMDDKKILHYTTAVLSEIQRYICLVPLGFVRRNHSRIKVCGYRIPPKSNLIVNMWSMSRDPRYFKNPDQFDPNHFLNEEGHYVKKEANMPFSYGKRICIAYQVAEVVLFIGFATLMQKFNWEPPKPNEKVERKIHEFVTRVLHNYEVKAVPRQ